MRRYDIVKGDMTTVGGIVQGGDGQDVLHGREQAYEHDPVWCPVCKPLGVIVCDGPPILAVPDAAQLAGHAGVTFLVVRQGVTKHGEIKESIRRLRHVGVSPHGLIFNGLSVRPGRYAYGYGRYRHNRDSQAYYGKE